MCRYVTMCRIAVCLASHIRVRTRSKSLRCKFALFRVKNSMSCVYQAEMGMFSHKPLWTQYGQYGEYYGSIGLITLHYAHNFPPDARQKLKKN